VAGGRPLKFQDIDEFQAKIDAYFASCFGDVIVKDKDGCVVLDGDGNVIREMQRIKPFTITGLALALDTSRETLMEIERGPSDYSRPFVDALKRGKDKCQQFAEEFIFTGKNPAGGIFALKNYGWRDTQEVKLIATVRSVEQLLDDL
jgi:hypothetical protein